ncbi:MAG: agarase [Bacteroidales bacterium]|nr:agarase [Bacteroidales bacterium]
MKQLLLPVIVALTCLPSAAQTRSSQDRGKIMVEARPWDKQHPDRPAWAIYPSLTADSLMLPASPDPLNAYGSLAKGHKFKATGYFRVRKLHGRWIMVDPVGRVHIDASVSSVSPGRGETNKTAFAEKFRDKEDWAYLTCRELTSYGFNGAGTWSDTEAFQSMNRCHQDSHFTICPMLNLMSGYAATQGKAHQLPGHTGYPNQCIPVFDPGFEEYCDKVLADAAIRYGKDPDVIGYFSDNEMPLGIKNLEGYLDLPDDDYGHKAAARWLESKGIGREEISDDIRKEFAGFAADTYYSIVGQSIRKHDPNHMYLGSRLHGGAKYLKEVYQAAGRHCDIISMNFYGRWEISAEDLNRWETWSDTPFIITEFYTKAEDSGLANMTGAGWLVHDQSSRSAHYQNFVIGLLRSRCCVGWCWFKYMDNDPTASGVDPSNLNSNKGCYDNRYRPYADLVDGMRKVNSMRYSISNLRKRGNR